MGAPQYEQAGADIGGSGTTNTIPRWTGPSTLGDSGLIDNGTAIYTTARDVGIGTASPAARLHILAGADEAARIATSTTGAFVSLYASSTTLRGYFGTANSLVASGNAADLAIRVEGSNNIVFATSTTERARITTTALDISGAGYGLKLNATPGNTDPNTLDAYVDGGTAGGGGKTWTPADTSGAGLTLTVNSAQYVQVGKLVVMTADITYPVTASAAVAALSLPVSPAVNYFHAGSTGYQTTPAIAGLAPMVKNTAMNMWAYDTQQTNAQLSGKRLIFTVSYFMG